MRNFFKSLLLVTIESIKPLTMLAVLFLCSAAQGQQTYSFSAAGATGSVGPTQTQINAAYLATNLNGAVTVSAGIQSWTVPITGPYRIAAYGAQGGGSGDAQGVGGLGAVVISERTLTAGQVCKILVGQQGGTASYGGGGGGGSYVVDNSNNPFVIAGGGGGGNGYVGYSRGVFVGGCGLISTSGGNSNQTVGSYGSAAPGSGGGAIAQGGVNGYGGGGAVGGGGGGFYNIGGTGYAQPGQGYLQGGSGGSGDLVGNFGGFGGGAGGQSSSGYGGGGGGYSGGGGGNWNGTIHGNGGGGGSFNSGANQTATACINAGGGRVLITCLYWIAIAPTASISCNGFSTAALSATVNGGVGPFTYSWMPAGGTSSVATGLAAGTYTCLVTSATSGTVLNTFVVAQPAPITAAVLSQTNATCFNGNNGRVIVTTSGGTGPYSYTWSPITGATSTLSGLTANSYTVLIRDANNCTGNTVTAVITQPASFSVSASATNTLLCGSGSTTLTATGATTYTWTNGVSNGVGFAPTVTNNYSVTASNALGCPASNTAEVSVVVAPIPNINVNSGAICAGQTFTMNPSGASTYTLQGGNAVVSPASNTSYTVIGTSSLGCVSTIAAASNVTVNANPTITVNSGVICAGQPFTLLPAGANTYTIQGGNATVNPGTTSTYTLFGTSAAGCVSQAFATSTITVNPNPTITVNSGSICAGQIFSINPNGASTYTIQGGNAAVSPSSNSSYTVMGTSALGCISQVPATSSVVVNVNPTITVNSGAICAGQSYTLIPNGAGTYVFQGGNAVVNPSASTSYTVRGTSAAGCLSANTATSTVTVNANPTITVNSGTICAGQPFTLLPSGANTYTFQGGNAVVSPSLTTSYTVAGTNTLTGCSSQSSATSTLTVNQNPTLTVTGINTICAGQSASLVANGAATYTWSNAANTTSVVLTPSANTAYTLSGSTALGCTAAINPTVAVQPSITVNVAGPNSICNGQTASLTASGATSYTWNTAASSASIAATLSTSTTYSVIGVTGVCANFAVKTITVTPNPTVTITGTTAICSGSSASLTVNGATTYTWSTLSTNTSVVVSPSATTVYSVVGSFSTGCAQLAAQTVSVYALPVVSISGPSVVCVGGSITLNANGAATYVWNNTATTASIVVSPTATASYSAICTNTNGCNASASATVTVNPLPVMSVVKTTSAVCQGDSLSFTATGADTYSWSTGAITNSIVVTPTSSATYSVVGTNTFGCISLLTDSVKVNAVPVLTITGNTGTICIGETLVLNLNGAATYSWSTGASTSSISVSPSIASTYSATGTSTDACVSAITASVQVSECTGLNAHTSATSVKVYPNPSNGEFTLELSSVNKSVITITTILGQVVLSQEAGLIQQINLSELNKGLYFINVTENNKSVYRTNIVKQ